MNLDFSKIDLITENAQLKLELIKNDFRVKPEPVVIKEECSSCLRNESALSRLRSDAEIGRYARSALGGFGCEAREMGAMSQACSNGLMYAFFGARL